MANVGSIPLYEEVINNFSDRFNTGSNDSAVQALRKKGFDSFKKNGFPNRRNEEWKYTNITPYLLEKYSFNKAVPGEESITNAGHIPNLDCYRITLINGVLQQDNEGWQLPSFITISTIEEAQNNELFSAYFSNTGKENKSSFAALNSALFVNGLFIAIAPNAVLEKPLHIVHVFHGDQSLFVQPRQVVVVGRGANMNIIESIVSENNKSKIFVNSYTEVFVEGNAVCDHYMVQTAKEGMRLVNQTEISQKRHSVYTNYTFSLPSADLIRNNLHVSLDEPETESHLFGLYLGSGQQMIDNHSLVNHKMPHCNSNEIYKGVLTESSVGVFNGKIYVQPDAQKTNAFQQNNNLLLGDKSTINSKPQLEIFADDVKCSHGSTVGQLSKEAMFYLQSRGIGEQKARALLVKAFVFDVTEKIKIPVLEDYINQLITLHIPLAETIAEDVA